MSTAAATEGFELSPRQQRLWALQQADDGSCPVYHARCAIEIEGDLDPVALRTALEGIVERHEILRTTFAQLPGLRFPLQVIGGPLAPAYEQQDLSGVGQAEQERRLAELSRAADARPDFGRGPLLRACLLTLSATRHLLLVSLPALCADGPSLDLLVSELARAYEAGRRGEPLAGPGLQYVDLAAWQNELLRSDETRTGRAHWEVFWHRHRPAALGAQRLPFERALVAGTPFRPEVLPLSLGSDLLAKLDALARARGIPQATCLLACYQALLRRLTGLPEPVVGVAYDGRTYDETRAALGLFRQYLPAPARFDDSMRFDDLLRQVRRSADEAAAWQEYFAWGRAGETPDVGAQPPYFPFAFEFDERPSALEAAGLLFSRGRRYACSERFDLKLAGSRGDGGLLAEWHYDASRFDRPDVERLAGYFERLLQGVLAAPSVTIDTHDLLGEAERRQVLVEFNATRADTSRDRCLHELFEAQVERTPERVAVVFEGRHLTYAELNARANQLAHQLRALGVGPETPVGLCLQRSLEMVVGVLGILTAGGAYVPLDPTYPRERLAFVLADSRAPVLVTETRLLAGLPEHAAQTLCLDPDWAAIAAQPATNPRAGVNPRQAAYIIYTSGSTGRPKGVVVEHRSPINLLTALEQAVYSDHPDRPLRASLNAPLSFDASMQQLILLLRGHTLDVIPQAVRLDARALLAYLRANALDVLDCTPSQLRLLVADGLLDESEPAPAVVLVAGEAIDEQLWRALASSTRIAFYNVYGPTECTVDATAGRVRPGSERPTIGRSLPGYRAYVLDRHLRPLPIGVPGELHLGGPGLARGYLHRPGLTAERFLPDPYAERPGERLYRTGDQARYLPDGCLEFLGRLDQQVKLRGFRIELGEIEAALARHPTAREVAVVAREQPTGDPQLVAYLVPRAGTAPVVGDLRRFLRDTLPDYMVPGAIVIREALPMLPNGKVDRGALPAPDSQRPDLGTAYVAPRTVLERNLVALWQQVLGVDRVGLQDNFFDLGGHSLLVVQVHRRLAEIVDREVSLIDLFAYPTVGALAAYLSPAEGALAPRQEGVDRAATRRASLQRQRQRVAARQRARSSGR